MVTCHRSVGHHRVKWVGILVLASWIPFVALQPCVGQEKVAGPGASNSRVSSATEAPTLATLAAALEPFYEVFSGRDARFSFDVEVELSIDGKPQTAKLRLTRFDDQSFDLEAVHPDYAVTIRRRLDATSFALPNHGVVYEGKGEVLGADHLAPIGMVDRLISPSTILATYLPLLSSGDARSTVQIASALIAIRWDSEAEKWMIGKDVSLAFEGAGESARLIINADDVRIQIALAELPQPQAADDWPQLNAVTLDRVEIETQLARGFRRAMEVLLPSPSLMQPEEHPKKVAHGELRYVEGQRLAILEGTPEEIGTAHGQLLQVESERCIDSVLNAFGTVQTIATGRWFRHDLQEAYAKLQPHIPVDHIAETRALAIALGQDPAVMEMLNVFPELFHCSGFAVFGSATTDGKLYHGRVLDYMTTIGLQDCATTFIVSVDHKIPFANVGYAAFTGSVSGMNARSISLGEMGGRGEGQWDGVPMATLMRRALEECSTLDQVIKLWATNPRTCEYYYVFADGKTNEAVGVAATQSSIQFIKPGEGHELLGEGITDTVVLSAGGRLETLRKRVIDNHGKIDADKAMWLMSRPVAMQSNLHNVLFVPQDGVFYVANADHKHPAAERPYVRMDLQALISDIHSATANVSVGAK